jgi:hypothetical protein
MPILELLEIRPNYCLEENRPSICKLLFLVPIDAVRLKKKSRLYCKIASKDGIFLLSLNS